MKRIIFLIALSVTLCDGFAQGGGTPNPYPQGELYRIREQMNKDLDRMHDTVPDSIFYEEGAIFSQFEKWFRYWEPRLSPHGDFSKSYEIEKLFFETQQDMSNTRANSDSWDEIGPKRQPTIGFTSASGIGPIEFITFFESDPDYVLCGSLNGGLFSTIDGGVNWINAGSDKSWDRSGVVHATFHPTNKLITFAATSDQGGNIIDRSRGIYYNGGIYRKGGSSAPWLKIADYQDFSMIPESLQVYFNKLLFDLKVNSGFDNTLFAATSRGLFKCDNPNSGSPSWNLITIPVPASIVATYPTYTFDQTEIYDLEYQPDVSGPTSIMYAAVRFHGTDGPNTVNAWVFMQSNDDGATWFDIPGQPPMPLNPNTYTIEVSKANDQKLYCVINPKQNEYYSPGYSTISVYHLTSGWTSFAPVFNCTFGGGHSFGVNPFNENEFLVSHTTYAKRFDLSNTSYVHSISSFHADVEDIVFHPTITDEVWIAHHGGIKKLNLTGTSTLIATDVSNGLGVAEVDALATSYTNPEYVAVELFHDGAALTDDPYGPVFPWDPDWKNIAGGDGIKCLIDKNDPSYIYTSGQLGSWQRFDNTAAINISTPIGIGAQWWSDGDLNKFNTSTIYRAGAVNNGITSYYSDPGCNTTLTPVTNNEPEIYRSFNKGNSGTNFPISDFANTLNVCLPAGSCWKFDWEMFSMIKSSPVNPDHLYVAMRDGYWAYRLFRTTNANDPNPANVTWEELPIPRIFNWLGGIAFHPTDHNIIYLIYGSSDALSGPITSNASKMVFRMDYSNLSLYPVCNNTGPYNPSVTSGCFDCTGGEPCEDITMNMPNTFVNGFDAGTIVCEKGSNEGLYVGTDYGVYYTNKNRKNLYAANSSDPNGGWVEVGTGFPNVVVTSMEINYEINRIRVGCYGRGVWEHDLYCPADYDLAESITYTADQYFEAENNITSTAVVNSGRDITYRAGNRIHLQPNFKAYSGSKFHAFIHACNHSGNSFRMVAADESQEWTENTELKAEEGFTLYPNPANGILNIGIESEMTDALYSVKVYDLAGKMVFTKNNLPKGKNTLDVSELKNGIYFIELTNSAGERQAKKLVKN